MGAPVVHFELAGPDHAASAKFYADLFGWEITSSQPELFYTTIDTHGGDGINGGFGSPPNGASYVTVYAAVPDLRATLDHAESLGAKILMDITEIPNVVTMAMISDPAGNAFGLIKDPGEAQQSGPGPSQGDGAAVDWFDILGPDGDALRSFYGNLFGWSFEQYGTGGPPYWTIDTGAGSGSAGGVGQSQDGQAQLNVYAHVDDVQKYVEQAEAAGGTTLVPPTKATDTLTFGIISEPKGTRFGLYTPA
ncbi:MAG: VOC family protein [Actinomycetota bacterium]